MPKVTCFDWYFWNINLSIDAQDDLEEHEIRGSESTWEIISMIQTNKQKKKEENLTWGKWKWKK